MKPGLEIAMAKARGDFSDILIRRKVLSQDQVEEARGLAGSTGIRLQDALIKLNYASLKEVMSAIAEFHNMTFVDLTDVQIPASVIEMVPESVARENTVVPLSHENNALQIVVANPEDIETLDKLRFI